MKQNETILTPPQRISSLLEYLKLSKNALGLSIGDKNGMRFQYILNGRNKNVSEKLASDITEAHPNINYAWLLHGKGTMLKNNHKEAVQIPVQFMSVPLVPVHAQAGFLSGYGDEAFMDELPVQYWEVDKEFKGNYVCFEVRGDSMDDDSSKAILDGDKLLTREIQRHLWTSKLHINKWNFVIVHKEEGIIVKKITEHNLDTGTIRCHSLNPFYEDFDLYLNDVIALYNVVDLKRKPLI